MKKNLFKRVCALMLAGAMAASMAACGGAASGSGGASSAAGASKTAAASGTGVTNGVRSSLNVGTQLLWPTLSPFQTTSNQYGAFIRAIYDRLAVIVDGKYVKQAAESWQVADDGVTWTVKIHDNIKDSAGNHITAKDVAWFIQESVKRALKPQFNKVKSVEAMDDTTFTVVMKSNVVGGFELVMCGTYMVSQAAFEASPDEFATTVVTSAPYEVVQFVPGSHLTLKKRADYWNAGSTEPAFQNNVENLTYTIIAEASQQQIALETGKVDAFEALSPSLVSSFDNNPAYGKIAAPSANGMQMYFSGDASRPVAEDVNLRMAICYSINVDGLISAAYDGLASPMHDTATSTLVGYLQKWDKEEYFPYDVEKAKDYLSKSNYSGQSLVLMVSNGTTNERLAQVLQGYLLAVGINCELKILDTALFAASRFDGAQYDMILVQAGGVTLTNFWGVRYDMNAYEKGDGTARRDETLTNMIYKTWTQTGFTEENIDAIHKYLNENCYAYGLLNPEVSSIYRTNTGLSSAPFSPSGTADFAAAVFK